MAIITTTDGTEIYFKDWGRKDAQPLFFHHGWPLSADNREAQPLFFVPHGYGVIVDDGEEPLFGRGRRNWLRSGGKIAGNRDRKSQLRPSRP